MVVMFRPSAVTGIGTAAVATTLLVLFSGHFQAFLAPEPIHPLEVNQPVFFTQLDGDPSIPIAGMLKVQLQHVPDHRRILVRQSGLVPLCTANLAQNLTGLSLCGPQLTASLVNNPASPGRD